MPAAGLTFLFLLGMSTWLGCARPPLVRGNKLGDQIKARYASGLADLMSGNYTDAVEAFQAVAKSPGYLTYVPLARLRVADALFLQEKYDAAIDMYRSFIKQYEGNPNVGYARFRVGHAYFEQIPSGWFLAPPVYERQQTFVVQAARELERFLDLHPTDRLAPQARKLLDECERKLYDHELYVATFYDKRDKPRGVIQRLEIVFERFPELAATEDNYLMLAKAYADDQSHAQAEAMYNAYFQRFPNGSRKKEADERIKALRAAKPSDKS